MLQACRVCVVYTKMKGVRASLVHFPKKQTPYMHYRGLVQSDTKYILLIHNLIHKAHS